MRSAALLALPLLACGSPKPAAPTQLRTTYRAIQGFSMGAIGTASLLAEHPERFDAAAPLGGPLDAALLLHTVDDFHLGGFCSLADLEAIAAKDPTQLNNPTVIDACSRRPATIQYEHSQDFNHWAYTTNGSNFDRTEYWDIFADLTLAYGNFLYDNPASPFAPPGVDPERLRHPPADFCSNPVHVKGLLNAEYNPQGKYDAITFCDGQAPIYYCASTQEIVDFCSDPANIANPLTPAAAATFAASYCLDKGGAQVANDHDNALMMLNNAGKVDACRLGTVPATVALAIDINGNGRRDYGEPVVSNAQERFKDIGIDGCADAFEDGHGGCLQTPNPSAVDPNHDNYDSATNPTGTENDWIWEPGEPFDDYGLDGLPGTGDEGEGNGVFDMSVGRHTLFQNDARTMLKQMSPEARFRINWLLDGGIRDVFNLGLCSKQVFGLVSYFFPGISAAYRDFTEIPGMKDPNTGYYQPWGGPWRLAPKNMLVLYGKDNPTDQDRIDGDGDHVGTTAQAAYRAYTMLNWLSAQWPSLPKPVAPLTGSTYGQRTLILSYDSQVLGAKREYGIYLPPGYDDPANANARYPVAYLLHGYGMDPAGYISVSLVVDSYTKDPSVQFRPMILVFPDGDCCFVNTLTGARDCRETNDQGISFGSLPGWERECHHGTFFINRRGYTQGDAVRYGDSFFELMDYIDSQYRTLPPADLESR